MKKINLNSHYGALVAFVSAAINDSTAIESLEDLKRGNIVLLERTVDKQKTVTFAIVEGVSEDGKTLSYKTSKLAAEVEEWTPKSLDENLFRIDSTSLHNFKGLSEDEAEAEAERKEIFSHLKDIQSSPNDTTRVGSFFAPEEMKNSEEGKKLQEKVVNHFKEKLGIEVSLRFNKTCGKIHDMDATPGFNILAVNPDLQKPSDLFKQGSHYYRNNELYTVTAVNDNEEIEIVDADDDMKRMISEVAGA